MLRNRLIVLGLIILSVVAISFYGGPITYGFFFLMLSIPLISAGYALLEYYRFRIYQVIVTKNVVVGTPTEYYFSLQNEDFYPFSGVRVEFFSDFSQVRNVEDNSEYELSPKNGVKKETTILCKYRGEYEVGIKNVYVEDYLRLFTFNFKNRETLKAIVLPRLEILDSLDTSYSFIHLKDSNHNPCEPDVCVREYGAGDDIRNINWKTSAHMGKLYVRNKTGNETPSISIIMDSCRYKREPEEFLPLENKILETVLALTHFYLKNGIKTAVHTLNDEPLSFRLNSISSFEDFYSSMSVFHFHRNQTLVKLLENVQKTDISESSLAIFIVHEIGEEVKVMTSMLQKNSIPSVIYHITDDAKEANLNIGKNTIYKRIGYDDRLKEVL